MAISFRLIPKGSLVNLASLLTRTAPANPKNIAIATGDVDTRTSTHRARKPRQS